MNHTITREGRRKYWSGSETSSSSASWDLWFQRGQQDDGGKNSDKYVWAVHDGDVGNPILSVPLVICVGADNGIFDTPMDVPVTVNKRARVLPFNMLLIDENGYSLSDADIEPPMIQVVVTPGATDSAPPPEALDSVGKGDEGNQFSYSDTTWAFNLKTSNFSGSGRYTATVVSGDPSSYVISPTCEGTFYITR